MAKSKFDLKSEIEKLANNLTSDIFSPKKRAEIKREYIEHIEDAVYRYKISGMEEKEAFKKASEDIGDASKTRFLLSGVHNNKFQLFIVDRILRKIRNLFTNVRFLRALLLFAIGFCVVFAFLFYVLISVIGGDSFVRGTVEFLSRLAIALSNFVPLVLGVVVLFLLLPILSLVYLPLCILFERCTRYFSLFFWSLFRGYSYRIKKLKFCNSYKIDASPNVIIKKKGKSYALHFIDLPRGHKKVFLVMNSSEYRIYNTEKEKGYSFIRNNYYMMENEDIPKIFRGANRIMDEESYVTYNIPRLSDSENTEHIVLIFPNFAYAKYMLENKLIDIGRDTKIGDISFQKYKYFRNNKYF